MIMSSPFVRHVLTIALLLVPTTTCAFHVGQQSSPPEVPSSRRAFFQNTVAVATTAAAVMTTGAAAPTWAAEGGPPGAKAPKRELDDCLYTILRVKEATAQETRLIQSGKFKDVQRANVKLAVKFILQNYRLQDTFITASSYIPDNQKRIEAGNVGTSAVQALLTILEYFDSSDVQNIKVGSSSMSGSKEDLVLKGLDSTKKSIDEFLTYMPVAQVEKVLTKIKEENELNKSEWDPALGDILNMPSVI
mmetsp:Transcript_25073/g.35101  ORF Transcript_25073/g.35101 Transcript_25073/m.35101 type:complete len:248 (+) Transcript_25073:50-793(+)